MKAPAYVKWNGHCIFLWDEGTGPVLLLIHGFPTSSWDWNRIWGSLLRGHRLIAVDMLGFGRSEKPSGHRYSILAQADLLEKVLADLGVQEVAIVSHDYGDSVAQELLARFELRSRKGTPGLIIRSLCFLNGGLFPETHRPLWSQKLLASPFGALLGALTFKSIFVRNLKSTLGPNHSLLDADFDAMWEDFSRGGGKGVLHELLAYIRERRVHRDRWVAAMQSTRVPLALVVGEADPISGAHMAARYRELVPDPRVTALPGVGHYPQLESPALVIAAIEKFQGENA